MANSLSPVSCFLLLDDPTELPSPDQKQSRLYTGTLRRIDTLAGWAVGIVAVIMRGLLLDHSTMNAREAVLTLDDLRNAQRIMVCSSLRGSLLATVDWEAALVDVA